jgi:hypothetical protein
MPKRHHQSAFQTWWRPWSTIGGGRILIAVLLAIVVQWIIPLDTSNPMFPLAPTRGMYYEIPIRIAVFIATVYLVFNPQILLWPIHKIARTTGKHTNGKSKRKPRKR